MGTTIQQSDELYSRNSGRCVLVAYASKHGSTREIARALAAALNREDVDVDVKDMSDVTGLDTYCGVVLGSAVYMGKVLPQVWSFTHKFRDALKDVPVWFFSSGPIGPDEPTAGQEAIDVKDLAKLISLRDHKVFGGKLDKRQLSVPQRIISAIVRAREGDYRNWDAITEWAREIAAPLTAQTLQTSK